MKRKPNPMPSRESIGRGRSLRKDSTFPERLLWSRLRGRQLGQLKFRRQHPVGPFIVDFYCHEARLIIELDGVSHDGRAKEDEERSAYLRREGVRVFRVTNDDVLKDMEAVLLGILRECFVELESGQRTKGPHPGPLPEGEGGRKRGQN